MKKLFFSLMLLLNCAALMADAPPAPSSQEFSMPVVTPTQTAPRQIRILLEIADNDIKDYGLSQAMIYNEIQTRLQLAQIQIKDEPKLPQLVLRIKSIQADRAIATFIQFSFYEEAILVRNQNSLQALTWSQATLISCAKEDLAKEVNPIIIQMINSFILDYQKALSPQ